MEPKLLKTIFNAIALAMGVAVIVLTILNTLSASTGWVLLGLAVAALGLAGLQK
jgi:VIT1/CCC1 family predicted Fe2+/Mn2+ transporter